MPPGRPNIILIMADDMGYSDIGCFGSEIRTPHVNQMSANGVTFTTAYNCARCCPSRASLLTGLYPHKAGIGHMGVDLGTPEYQGYLRNDCVTIAEALRSGGYRTLMSGKWHVGGSYDPCRADSWIPGDTGYPTPLQRGFDRFFGILDGACSYFFPHHLMEDDKRIQVASDDFYLTDAISAKAVEMVEESVSDQQPFFLYMAYTAPHWPLHAHPQDIEKYEGIYRKQGWDAIRTARHESMRGSGILDRQWEISARDHQAPPWQEIEYPDWEAARMAVYAAQVESMDRGIGSLLATLKRLNIEENTMVVFLSDNGGCAEFMAEDGWARWYPTCTPDGRIIRSGNNPDIRPGSPLTFMSYDLPWANVSNTPFRRFKHWVHEGGISTPLIVQWPAMITKGGLVHESAHIIDLMPTFLEAAGVPYPVEYDGRRIQALDGESLVPALGLEGWTRDVPLFWEHEGNCAIRSDEWKLVKECFKDWELYEMNTDRTELHDLSHRNQPVVKGLEHQFNEWAEQVGVVEWSRLVEKLKRAWDTSDVLGS
jgi:arylsulfatase